MMPDWSPTGNGRADDRAQRAKTLTGLLPLKTNPGVAKKGTATKSVWPLKAFAGPQRHLDNGWIALHHAAIIDVYVNNPKTQSIEELTQC
jgi:hypothetical protein